MNKKIENPGYIKPELPLSIFICNMAKIGKIFEYDKYYRVLLVIFVLMSISSKKVQKCYY